MSGLLFDMPEKVSIAGKRVDLQSKMLAIKSRSMHQVRELEKIHLDGMSDNHVAHIVTQKMINAFTFVEYFCSIGVVKELDIAIYCISTKTIIILFALLDAGQIEYCNLLVNDNASRMKPGIWQRLLDEAENRDNFTLWAQNNHAKVIMADVNGRFYAVEGSGNLNDNARVEQYTVTISEELVNWHRSWLRNDVIGIKKVKGKSNE